MSIDDGPTYDEWCANRSLTPGRCWHGRPRDECEVHRDVKATEDVETTEGLL